MSHPKSVLESLLRRVAAPLLGLVILCLPGPSGAAEPARKLRQKQAISTHKLEITRPAGLAYSREADLFIVIPSLEGGGGSATPRTAVMMTKFDDHAGSVALPASHSNPRAVAYDELRHRLLVFDVAGRSIHAIPGDASGVFEAGRTVRLAAPRVGPLKPLGMAVDPASGEVFVLDHLMRRILRFTPAAGDDPGADMNVPAATWIDLGPLAPLELRGLAFDPSRRHLFTLDAEHRALHELATDGQPLASYDVSDISLADPQSMVFAPSCDQTDDPATLSLFVADPGGPSSRHGSVVEMSFSAGEAIVTAAAAVTATLVRVTATSAFSPPSPDPSGVAYDAVSGRLIISDAEVEEMPIYAGKNIFETSLTGTLLRSWTTLPWDIEPCGSATNANNRHIFISNDDADRVWDVNPGADNLVGTGDDTRTSFKTNAFGCGDPEGISYDRVGNRLFIADGVGEEIWVVNAGPNGVFNGVPPTGDDTVTHFDTGVFGSVDPETVEWKSDTGTLLVLGSSGSKIVKEVTTTGTLLSQIDLSFAPLKKPAGMAYAPTSTGGGWSLYIVNRGTDNNSDPKENDGTLVEVSISGAPPANTAPTANAGPDQTITLPAQAVLDGTVGDDGLPSPPALTTTWSKVSGPGTVTFLNANTVDTQASFSLSGTYLLSLAASDGALSSSDQIQVTVNASSGGNVAPVVNAGPDQTITLPAQAVLDGTISDDGLPSPPALTTTWSKVSGPGTVTFLNANAVDTQASFSVNGTYLLSLTANDGALGSSDPIQITVLPAGSSTDFRVASGTDDVEEKSTGSVYITSTDIELIFDGANQTVGLRFSNVTIPKGATIASAYVQFQADEAQSEVTNLLIQGQAAASALPFTSTKFDVSARGRTAASVSWAPVAWNTVGETGPNQRTPELKTVVQEIVNQTGWASGNAMAVIITGTGHRTARAYEGNPAAAAVLHIEIAAAAAPLTAGPAAR